MTWDITNPRFPAAWDFDIIRLQWHGRVGRMKSLFPVSFRRALLLGAVTAAVAGLAANPAQARIFVGVGVPFYGFGPTFVTPPYYYPPPVYYAPPPVYYTPQPAYSPPAPAYGPTPLNRADRGQSCHASAYVCPMERPVANGESCYCIGNSGQKVWGRAG